jgi:hypothetical protein
MGGGGSKEIEPVNLPAYNPGVKTYGLIEKFQLNNKEENQYIIFFIFLILFIFIISNFKWKKKI